MVFEDIPGYQLTRVYGFSLLDNTVRRTAHGGSNGTSFNGPSFRVIFNNTSDLAVGDIVEMVGVFSAIDFKDAGWGYLI